jgi:hypothetical protein
MPRLDASKDIVVLLVALLCSCTSSQKELKGIWSEGIVEDGIRLKATKPIDGAVTNLSELNLSSWDARICMTDDELTLYFHSDRPGGKGNYDIFMSKRATLRDAWEEPQNIGSPINTQYDDFGVFISPDGLTLLFCSNRPGGFGLYDIWYSTRANGSEKWDEPKNMGLGINSKYNEIGPSLSPDGLELYFSDYVSFLPRPEGTGQADIWVSTRESAESDWSKAKNIGPAVNSKWNDYGLTLSRDGLFMFFTSNRGDQQWNEDIWFTGRESLSSEWKPPKRFDELINQDSNDKAGWISKDKAAFYFGSDRADGKGSVDLWKIVFEKPLEY